MHLRTTSYVTRMLYNHFITLNYEIDRFSNNINVTNLIYSALEGFGERRSNLTLTGEGAQF